MPTQDQQQTKLIGSINSTQFIEPILEDFFASERFRSIPLIELPVMRMWQLRHLELNPPQFLLLKSGQESCLPGFSLSFKIFYNSIDFEILTFHF